MPAHLHDPDRYFEIAETLRKIARDIRYDDCRVSQLNALADGFEGTGATANIVVVDAILTPRMREENPGEDFPTFTPAEQVAEAIAFLCSDAAEKMNGQRLPLTMRG